MWDPDYRNYLIWFFEEQGMEPPPNFFADVGAEGVEVEAEGEEEEMEWEQEEEETGEEVEGTGEEEEEEEDNEDDADVGANYGESLRQVLYGNRRDNISSPAGASSSQELVNVDTQASEGADGVIVVGACESSSQVRHNNGVKMGGVTEGDSDTENKRELIKGEIDGLFCPICFEAWSSGGDHHVCCLPCGHIYGLSCIKKWLRRRPGSNKCPQCKHKCRIMDIRLLYATQIVAVDGELEKTVRSLEAKCASLEKKTADWSKREVEWQNREADLCKQVQFLKERTHELEDLLEDMERRASGSSSSNLHCQAQSTTGLGAYHKFDMQRCSNKFMSQKGFHVDGARLFDIDSSSQIFVIARRISGMGAAHVLTKVSLLYNDEREDIWLPENMKVVKDLKVSPHAGHVLLASLGKKLSVLSMESNNTVLTYNLPAAAWSCSWDVSSSRYVYAGLQNGTVLQFDTRNTLSHVQSLTGLTCNPIHTLHCLSADSSFSSGTRSVLTASSIGLCQWNFDGTGERPYLIPDSDKQGVCISLAYCRCSDDIVASYRPKIEASSDMEMIQPTLVTSGRGVQGSHVLYKKMGYTYQKLGATCANVSDVRLPKSTIIDGVYQNPVFASGDELARELVLQELPSLMTVEHLKPQKHPIRDIKFTHVVNSGLLSCLTEDSFHLFTANL